VYSAVFLAGKGTFIFILIGLLGKIDIYCCVVWWVKWCEMAKPPTDLWGHGYKYT
jgi:hypothetical protein